MLQSVPSIEQLMSDDLFKMYKKCGFNNEFLYDFMHSLCKISRSEKVINSLQMLK